MQPKGRCEYIFDTTNNRWVPWEGTAVGFGGVTLFTLGGDAVGTHTSGTDYAASVTPALDVNAGDYGLFSGTLTARNNLLDNADAQAVIGATARLAGVMSRVQGFNGTTYDRLRSFAGNADNVTAPTLGLLGAAGFSFLFDGTNWDRARSVLDSSDAQASGVVGLAGVMAKAQAFNGTSFDRVRTNSAATLSSTTQPFAQAVADPGEWSINHTPTDNTQATISRAAGAAGVRHVCRSISATLIGLAAAAEATVLVNLRDGATGAGTILWSTRLLVTGTTGSETGITLSNLNIFGSAATVMTLEFAAAGGANTFEAVAMTGYDTI